MVSNGMMSPGGDSQYGFSRGNAHHTHHSNQQPHTNHYGSNGQRQQHHQNGHYHNHKSPANRNRLQSQADSVDDLPLPPPPNNNNSHTSPSSMSKQRSVSQPPHRDSPPGNSLMSQTGSPGPNVPPKIDRHKKPSRRSASSVNQGEGLYNSVNRRGNESVERNSQMRDSNMVFSNLEFFK